MGDECSSSKDTKDSSPKLIWSPQGRQQSLSLGINPIDNADDNIIGSHLCDECTKSILPIVCRKPESIS